MAPAFGSYSPDDVKWLLKDLSDVSLEAPIEEREEAIQSGGAHYAESLPVEYQPTEAYQQLFKDSLEDSAFIIAEAVAKVTKMVIAERGENITLVSLARAGTPIGILMKRYAKAKYGLDLPHFAVSIVRGKGIDKNALGYLAENYGSSTVVFVDGWTGKGAITKELGVAIEEFNAEFGTSFKPDVAVLADPAHSVRYSGTREDFLIPSACLNSTVSGLVSRTVLNDNFIGPDDYHGAKFYAELADSDYSNHFIDTITAEFAGIDNDALEAGEPDDNPSWVGWATIERVSKEYGINSVNLVKPGVGETTRVLLRRVPWKILVREDALASLSHVTVLAESRGVTIETVKDLPYSCIGLIHPNYTKGATGFDGKVSS
jgi:hypothetical protein